ncbi:MAG: hypothetical protein NZ898_11720 [Myxococcota bacterium]|nr:hypothetical protein [Myxococcota bacterium]MDW8362329.1 hypothetical protein [Myxococcales bacterium]
MPCTVPRLRASGCGLSSRPPRVVPAYARQLGVRRVVATAWLLLAATGESAVAQHDGVLEIRPPEALTVGGRGELQCLVRLEPPADEPLVLTVRAEGDALEVLRRRLLRVDAARPSDDPLELRVPVLGRAPGTAVLRVRLETWSCRVGSCRRVVVERNARLRVDAP